MYIGDHRSEKAIRYLAMKVAGSAAHTSGLAILEEKSGARCVVSATTTDDYEDRAGFDTAG